MSSKKAASDIQPFQHLCNILKSIASDVNDEEAKEKIKSRVAPSYTPIFNNSSNNPEDTDMSKFFDSDFSCFFCRKKCFSKERFFSHFRVHFGRTGNKLNSGKRRHSMANNANCDEASDEGSEDEIRAPKRRRRFKQRPNKRPSEDGDSGCHSVESGSATSLSSSSSDNNGGVDDDDESFLGDDSQTSSSDENEENAEGSDMIRTTKLAVVSRKNRPRVSQRDRLSLAERQLDNNETEGLVCLTCLKRFSNCQNLRRHLRLHIARDSITPDIDKSSGAAAIDDGGDGARADKEDDGGFGGFICDWCPARFDNRSAARIHEAGHKGQETVCYVCDKRYADRYSLRYHLRTHGIGRQIRCEYCNKSFSKPSRLEAHVRSHHQNIRDFACSVCSKAFKTRVHLRNHFRQHSGERPFACPHTDCAAGFRHKASLEAHLRSHVGSRPFCCEVCGKTFREPSTLKAHSRVHTGDRPYKCLDCGKSFTQRAGLNYHKTKVHAKPSSTDDLKEVLPEIPSALPENAAPLPDNARAPNSNSTPLPSPPIQSGDAVFLKHSQSSSVVPTPLPSFDNLKQGTSGFLGHLGTPGTPHYEDRTNVSPPLTPPNSTSSQEQHLEMAEYLSMQEDLFEVQITQQQSSTYNNNHHHYAKPSSDSLKEVLPENATTLPESAASLPDIVHQQYDHQYGSFNYGQQQMQSNYAYSSSSSHFNSYYSSHSNQHHHCYNQHQNLHHQEQQLQVQQHHLQGYEHQQMSAGGGYSYGRGERRY